MDVTTLYEAELLSTFEAARHAGVSPPTISGWIGSGYLPSRLIGRQRVVRRRDLAQAQCLAHAGVVIPSWRAERQRVGQRLRAYREAAGLSQLELAAAAGLTHEALSLLEVGRRWPHAATVHKLAQALAVVPEAFIAHTPLGLSQLTTTEVAAWLDVPEKRVRAWLANGDLAGHKVSGRWRVPAVAVVELERSGRLRGASRRLGPRSRG